MGKYSIKLSPQAYDDLDQIYEHIALEIQAPDAALSTVKTIEDAILSLDDMPGRGALRKTGEYANCGYRQLFVKNFTIVYRIDETDRLVIIITVRYSRRNF